MDDFRQQFSGILGRLGHAYILSCPDPETLEAAVSWLSAAYVCTGEGQKPCLRCAACRKALAGIHPDVIRVAPADGKKGITVDQVRTARKEAYIMPGEAEHKVLILEQAQTLNDSGQNALLKILEEGPSFLAILFLTEEPEQLLPTIRSRCECLSLRPAEDAEEAEAETAEQANRLAGLLLGDDERALAEFTARLEQEKLSREDLRALLDETERALIRSASGRPERALPAAEYVKELRQALEVNAGAGHLLGALTAAAADGFHRREAAPD